MQDDHLLLTRDDAQARAEVARFSSRDAKRLDAFDAEIAEVAMALRALAVQAPDWREALIMTEWRETAAGWVCETGERALVQEGDGAMYAACVLGLRDYVNKNGFSNVVLGLSGGIDSAICAATSASMAGRRSRQWPLRCSCGP